MRFPAKSVSDYLSQLPEDRREAIQSVRNVVLEHLPEGLEEGIGYGMIGYSVPLSVYPDTYNGQPLLYAAIASQKSHMAVYLMCAYGSKEVDAELRAGFQRAGKRLDMGKSCIRFKRLEDLALDAIGKAVSSLSMTQYIALDQAVHGKAATGAKRGKAAQKTAMREAASRKAGHGTSKPRTAAKKTAKRSKVGKK
jgi:uncharacterized protein YdhG (YjbR/CyaY superfamily)